MESLEQIVEGSQRRLDRPPERVKSVWTGRMGAEKGERVYTVSVVSFERLLTHLARTPCAPEARPRAMYLACSQMCFAASR